MIETIVKHVEYDHISYKTSDGKIFDGEEGKSKAEAHEEYLSKKEIFDEFLKFHKKDFKVRAPYIISGADLSIDVTLSCYIIDSKKSKELLIEYLKHKFTTEYYDPYNTRTALIKISEFTDYGKWIAVTNSARVFYESDIINNINWFINDCEEQKKKIYAFVYGED